MIRKMLTVFLLGAAAMSPVHTVQAQAPYMFLEMAPATIGRYDSARQVLYLGSGEYLLQGGAKLTVAEKYQAGGSGSVNGRKILYAEGPPVNGMRTIIQLRFDKP